MTNDDTKKAKKTVIKKIEQYNCTLTRFQSVELKIVIKMIIIGSGVLFYGVILPFDCIMIWMASFFTAAIFSFAYVISDDSRYTSNMIYLNPSRAAFYASQKDNRPILLHPLLDKTGFWQKMVSKHTKNDDLVIGTISKLKTYSIVYYERERSHKDINVTD
jgi:hypothetical protein